MFARTNDETPFSCQRDFTPRILRLSDPRRKSSGISKRAPKSDEALRSPAINAISSRTISGQFRKLAAPALPRRTRRLTLAHDFPEG